MEPAVIFEFHLKIQNPEYPYKDTFCARVCARAYTHTQTQTKQRHFREIFLHSLCQSISFTHSLTYIQLRYLYICIYAHVNKYIK